MLSLGYVSVSFSLEGEVMDEVRAGSGLDSVPLDSPGSVTLKRHYQLEAKYERMSETDRQGCPGGWMRSCKSHLVRLMLGNIQCLLTC